PPSHSFFFSPCYCYHRHLHSFPTRRSSDLRLSGDGPASVPLWTDAWDAGGAARRQGATDQRGPDRRLGNRKSPLRCPHPSFRARSEEHTSELQSRGHLVCRLLLEKKKTKK